MTRQSDLPDAGHDRDGGPLGRLVLLTPDQMARADRLAIAGGVSGRVLMERAGRAVAEAVAARHPRGRVAVLCGPGNNGGDGFVAARHLAAKGWPVQLGLLGSPGDLKGDAAAHAALWKGPILPMSGDLLAGAEIVVDGLFGAGLSKPLSGAAAETVAGLGRMSVPVIAIDVPSGLDGASGQILGDLAVAATLTVTFFRKKPGHFLLPGRDLCGPTQVVDIGIPPRVLAEIAPRTWENDPACWRAYLPSRRSEYHKYHYGHALVSTGPALLGASILAGRAALRVGAGLLSFACGRDAFPILVGAVPSAMTRVLEAEPEFETLLSDRRVNAVLIGPGAGVGPETRARALAALRQGKKVVLDADALTALTPEAGALTLQSKGDLVLTPHEGEFSRLFSDLTGDKLSRARAAAARCGATLLLKGADTVVAAPDGRALVNANAPPWLATAGSGDVLAGLILGLLAQGMPGFEAAAAAAWIHGRAGTLCGPGLLAEDLPGQVPKVVVELVDTTGRDE